MNQLQCFFKDEYNKKTGTTSLLYKYLPMDDIRINSLVNNKIWFSDMEHLNDPFDCNVLLPKEITETDIVEIRKEILLDKTIFPIDIENNQIAYYISKKEKIGILENAYLWAIQFKNQDVIDLLLNKDIYNNDWIKLLFNAMMKIHIKMLNKLTIFSMSKINNSKLLWAHYGNNFRGFCIGYIAPVNVNPAMVFKVKYIKSLERLKPIEIIGDSFNVLNKITMRKPIDWEYEKEWRAITSFKGLIESMFPIKQIIFGNRIEEKHRAKLITSFNNGYIEFFEAVPNLKSDNMEIEIKRIKRNGY